MKKFRNFLNQTSEITNGQRLTIMACTLALMGIGYWRNYAAFKAESKNIALEWKLEHIKGKLEDKGFSKEDIKDLEKPF